MNPVVTIKIENQEIKYELDLNSDLNCIDGLIEAIHTKSLDNMYIERIVPKFVLQPWCDESKLGEFYQYVCDLKKDNDYIFDQYSVGLAGDGSRISVPSCIFITLDHAYHLNHKFTKIGKVISGFEYIHKIEKVELKDVPNNDNVSFKTPVVPILIQSVTIELNGYEPKECIKYIEKSA